MKKKLFSFQFEKLKILSEKSQVLSQFELIEFKDISVEELLNQKYDIIDFESSEYNKFSSFIKLLDWKTSVTGSADTLVFDGENYKPQSLIPEAIIRVIKKNISRVNSQRPVIVVGDSYFVTGVVSKLLGTGFTDIIFSLTDFSDEVLESFNKRISSYAFNLNLKHILVEELTSSELDAHLMICNFKKETNIEAYELLAYFNFLSEGAIFIDCNSILDPNLIEDAKKADVFFIEEVEVLETKFNKLLELLKISPKV